MSATRYDGKDLGNFEYYGTRSDDPNDIYPTNIVASCGPTGCWRHGLHTTTRAP